jgi:methylglyoxal synthase
VVVGTDAVLPVELAQTADGAAMVESGVGLMVMFFEPLEEQPAPDVTVTLRVTGLTLPAVKVMLAVLAALVIVPPVMVQA